MAWGIVGVALCGLLAPIAWVYGTSAVEDNLGTPHEGLARAGQILGIVGTALLFVNLLSGLVMLSARSRRR